MPNKLKKIMMEWTRVIRKLLYKPQRILVCKQAVTAFLVQDHVGLLVNWREINSVFAIARYDTFEDYFSQV